MSSILPSFVGLLCFVCYCSATNNKKTEVVLLQVLWRHGDRNPIMLAPKDPLKESDWPQGFEQLTEDGMRQHFALGRFLRHRYIDGKPYKLLDANYNRFQVLVRSTDIDRTLMSAESDLAGLFPPSKDHRFNPKLDWQPIPVHTVPTSTDNLLNMNTACPAHTAAVGKILQSDDMVKFQHDNKEFFAFVGNQTGVDPKNIFNMILAYDAILIEKIHGFPLPAWINTTWGGQTAFDKLQGITDMFFYITYAHPSVRRLRGGNLLGEIVKNMEAKKSGKLADRRCFIYSAHDETVAALEGAMNVYNHVRPPYTAAVIVELHKRDNEYFVKLLYRNDSHTDPHPYVLRVPGCAELCPLKNFTSLMQGNIPTDWHAECFGKTENLSADIGNDWISQRGLLLAAATVGGLAVLVCCVAVVVSIIRRRRQAKYGNYHRLPSEVAS